MSCQTNTSLFEIPRVHTPQVEEEKFSEVAPEDVIMSEERSSLDSKPESETTFAHPSGQSKKRRRSTSPPEVIDGYVIRKSRKKRLAEDETVAGASYVRYEKTLDKNGKTKLQAVRYSIRNDAQAKETVPLATGVDESFIYEPTEMEKLFSMSTNTQSVRQMIVAKVEKLRVEDIEEVIDANVQNLGEYALVKLKAESRDRFGGEDQVACALKESTSQKKKLSMQSSVLLNLRNRNLGK